MYAIGILPTRAISFRPLAPVHDDGPNVRYPFPRPFCVLWRHWPTLWRHPIARKRGVYLWTVRYKNGYLVEYVGITGRSFGQRQFQHIQDQCSGVYNVDMPGSLRSLRTSVAWHGLGWGPKRWRRAGDFLSRMPQFARLIHQVYGQYRLFCADLDLSARVLERIEAGISFHLKSQPGLIGKGQEDGIVYRPRRQVERPIKVRVSCAKHVWGLPDTIEA